MIIATLGIPGAFTAWGIEIVRHLSQAARPGLQQRWIDRVDAFEYDANSNLLVCSRFPSRSLREALSTQQVPTVLFTTSALDAVNHQRQRHQTLREAVRTVGASAALICDCNPQKQALILDAFDKLSVEAVIRAVAAHLGYVLSPELVSAVQTAVGPMPAPRYQVSPKRKKAS